MHKYVGFAEELLQDSSSCVVAKTFDTIEDALQWVNRTDWWPRDNHQFYLFELGRQIPLETVETIVPATPQPPVVKKIVQVKQ